MHKKNCHLEEKQSAKQNISKSELRNWRWDEGKGGEDSRPEGRGY